jgi:hypothetical protein
MLIGKKMKLAYSHPPDSFLPHQNCFPPHHNCHSAILRGKAARIVVSRNFLSLIIQFVFHLAVSIMPKRTDIHGVFIIG